MLAAGGVGVGGVSADYLSDYRTMEQKHVFSVTNRKQQHQKCSEHTPVSPCLHPQREQNLLYVLYRDGGGISGALCTPRGLRYEPISQDAVRPHGSTCKSSCSGARGHPIKTITTSAAAAAAGILRSTLKHAVA